MDVVSMESCNIQIEDGMDLFISYCIDVNSSFRYKLENIL